MKLIINFMLQVAKKRDKQERKILDSQERAFWDVYRPPPGQVNTTEMDIKKMYKLSAIFGQEQAMVGTEKTEHSQLRRELAALQVTYNIIIYRAAANDPSVFTITEKAPTGVFSWL